ncbi:hypothetical protein GOB94_11400 [Granulicella sp. 5B5]|uniref:hypothetical protein n=1 Tax=Granulicella sp. 5B5 TaxID=1617967 RepID=UPI0015F5308F|nr:hypothetical protein [Granulicella sp. 5B5]QMV19213.1 hypothetical protein GOB94_11400 [Granulicella sp. 5B5]
MRLRMVMLTAVVCAGSWVAAGGQVSGETVPHRCALNNGVYTCSWSAFEDTLAAAKTVSVQSDPMDERTNHALKRLARKLGKTVVETGDGPADLQFLLVPLNKDGVYVGPADVALATLRVYADSTPTHRGTLVWAETYRGEKDIPWPSVVYYTIHQFEERAGVRSH